MPPTSFNSRLKGTPNNLFWPFSPWKWVWISLMLWFNIDFNNIVDTQYFLDKTNRLVTVWNITRSNLILCQSKEACILKNEDRIVCFIEAWFFYFQEKIYFVKFIFRCIIEPNIFNTVEIDEKYILYAKQLYPEMFTL